MKKIFLGLMFLLVMVGCTKVGVSKTEMLSGKQYTLTQEAKNYQITLNFAEDNVFGFAGVNHYFGKYQIEGNKIIIGEVGSTKMAGPEDVMKIEDEFLTKLGRVSTYEVIEKGLILTTSKGEKLEFSLIKTLTEEKK